MTRCGSIRTPGATNRICSERDIEIPEYRVHPVSGSGSGYSSAVQVRISRFLGFDLTIFTNGGIGIPRKRRDPNSDPARDFRQKWRLPLYSVVKEPDAASF